MTLKTFKHLLTSVIVICLWYSFSHAILILDFPDINIASLQNNFSNVLFTAPWNNFGGGIFWLATKSLTTNATISLGWITKTCSKQVRGLYYNSQRGKRMWPLDDYSLGLLRASNVLYNTLQITGWFFTTCEDTYSIYWMITYDRNGTKSYVIAWIQLDYTDNHYLANFANSFQYFDNKTPLGYIRDSNGWIGFIWGVISGSANLITYINNGGTINSGFTYSGNTIDGITTNRWLNTTINKTGSDAINTLRNLVIQWTVWLSLSMNEAERLSLLGNLKWKTVVLNSSDINSSTLINIAKKKSQKLCKWQTLYTTTTLPINDTEKIVCYADTSLTIDLNDPTSYMDKSIFMMNGNIIFSGGMQASSPKLDLFLDSGLVYLPNTGAILIDLDTQWFPATNNGVNSWLYLKGNFIINGLLVWWTWPWMETWFTHKLHIQGKITTLNTPLTPAQWRINQVDSLFGNTRYENFVNLQNIFVRECGLNGIANDGTLCLTWDITSTTPLVILDGNYSSLFIQ